MYYSLFKKHHLHKDTSEWLVFNSYCKGLTLSVHLYTRGYSSPILMFFKFISLMWGLKNVLLVCQCIVVSNCLDINWVILRTTSNLNFKRNLHLQGGRTSPTTWQCFKLQPFNGPHVKWKIYLATKIFSTKVANWQPTDKKKEGKNVKNLSILGQIINELTVS